MCIAMAETIRLQGMIAIRKLIFLGRLIWLDEDLLSSKIFKARALQYISYDFMEVRATRQLGFVADVVFFMRRYDLIEHWEKLISSGFKDFPSIQRWKLIVKKAIYAYEQHQWDIRTQQESDFIVFRKIHGKINTPAKIWKFANSNSRYLAKCRVLAKFIARTPKSEQVEQLCIYCGLFYRDIYTHLTFECNKSYSERNTFWDELTDTLIPQFSVYLYNLPDEDMYCCMLGGEINISVTSSEEDDFMQISANFLSNILKFVY